MPAVLIPPEALASLAARLPGVADELRVTAVPCDIEPLDLVRAGAPGAGRAVYFSTPDGIEVGGLGTGWRATTSGTDRLSRLSAQVAAAGLPPDTVLLIGFSFQEDGPTGPAWDGYPAAVATLPAVSIVRRAGAAMLVLAIPAGRDPSERLAELRELEQPEQVALPDAGEVSIESHPPPGVWRDLVAHTVEAIAGEAFTKVVLAREVVVRSRAVADPFGVLHLLRDGHPQCFAFGWQEGDATFVGATPELLVARHGEVVRSEPLAGSAPRGEGDEDGRFGQSLLVSTKDLAEHAPVVDDIVARLRLLTTGLEVPSKPVLRRFGHVQHLATEIVGRLVVDRSVLELAGELHPTPAVGGVPRGDALAYIDKVETSDRGWYTGGVGWCLPSGDGEVAVALRCGLLRAQAAHLYAGNGIVAGSDPQAELEETRWKFRPLADLLTVT